MNGAHPVQLKQCVHRRTHTHARTHPLEYVNWTEVKSCVTGRNEQSWSSEPTHDTAERVLKTQHRVLQH